MPCKIRCRTMVLSGLLFSLQSLAQVDTVRFYHSHFTRSQLHLNEVATSSPNKNVLLPSVTPSISVIPVNEKQIRDYAASITDKFDRLTHQASWRRQELNAKMLKLQGRALSKLKRSHVADGDILNLANSDASLLASANQNIAHYLPSIDSLQTSLRFLNGLQSVSQNKELQKRIQEATKSIKGFEQELKIAEDTKRMISNWVEQLSDKLTSMGGVNLANKFKELQKLKGSLVVYSQQVQQFKDDIHDPSKAISTAMNILSKTKLYQDFMTRNSALAGIFGYPRQGNDSELNASDLGGLQTHSQVDQLVHSKMETGGAQAIAQVQQNMQQAKSVVNSLKDKVAKFGQGSSDLDTKFVTPNSQQSKTFLQRIEYTTNIQTQRSNSFFPVTTDIGLGVGYKLSDSKTIGIGLSYKVGLGSDFRHIAISHQGVGLRSFVDWKFKHSLYVSGGFEMNYRTLITSFDQLRAISGWQQSGLIGITKKVNVQTKLITNTKLQLYWDFLSYYQIPRAQPLIFRLGYTL